MSPGWKLFIFVCICIFTYLQRKVIGDCNRLGDVLDYISVRDRTFSACDNRERRRRSFRTLLVDFSSLSRNERNISLCNCTIMTNRINVLNVFETNLPDIPNCGSHVTFTNPVIGRTYKSTCDTRANFSSLMIRDLAFLSLENVDGIIRSSDYCIRIEGSSKLTIQCEIGSLSSEIPSTIMASMRPMTRTMEASSVNELQSTNYNLTVLVLAALLAVSLVIIFGLSATIIYLKMKCNKSRSSILSRYEVPTYPDPLVQYDTLQKDTLTQVYAEITA